MKNKKNITLYLCGRLISLIGTGIQQVALPLFILDVTHSGILMGVFSALNLIPMLLFSPLAGILGDSKDRRKLMIVFDFGRGILIFSLSILAFSGNLNIYILFICQIFLSTMDSIFYSASTAIIGELLDEDELMKAMSTRGGLDAISMIIGPVLGGTIYGFWGIKAVFLINSCSFIISGIMSMLMVYVCKNHTHKKITVGYFFNENKEVLKFIKNDKGLIQLATFAMLTNLLISPFFNIIMPYVVKKSIGFSSQQYGYLVSAFTIGILLGNVILNILKLKMKTIMNFGLLVQAVLFFIMFSLVFPKTINSLGGHSLLLFAFLALICLGSGLSNALYNTPLNTNLQKMVPNSMRSRFFALLGVISNCAIPIGSIIYGLLLDKIQYYYLVFIIAILNAIATLIFVLIAINDVYEPIPVKD